MKYWYLSEFLYLLLNHFRDFYQERKFLSFVINLKLFESNVFFLTLNQF